MVYTLYIIPQSTISNYSINNQRDLVMDTAENLTQIAKWTLHNFAKEQQQIELYMKLTKKNVKALETFPLSTGFLPGFTKFCHSFEILEKEYQSGIADKTAWANDMLLWSSSLTDTISLI